MMRNTHRKLFIGIMTLLTVTIGFGQNNFINYKAIIKDDLGNVVSNENIAIRFTILRGVSEVNVYQETHSPITDQNGLVVLEIGNGTVDSGAYNAIDWGSDDHFLNVQVSIGSGLVDLGTTAFNTVPYAMHSFKSSSAENAGTFSTTSNITSNEKGDYSADSFVFGSPQISYSGNPIHATRFYFDKTNGSFRAGIMNNSAPVGLNSMALGANPTASGQGSFAIGTFPSATESNAIAIGQNTLASGNNTTSIGYYTNAESHRSVALGSANIGGGNSQAWVETDPLFEIGNSNNFNNRSNALTILKNGTITAPSFDVSEITNDKALVTKEYLEDFVALEALDEGFGIGYRIIGRDPNNYGIIGLNAVDLSWSNTPSSSYGATGQMSLALGSQSTASASNAVAIGNLALATGIGSFALGEEATANSFGAFAIGNNSTASGFGAVALTSTTASGSNSFSQGSFSLATGDNSFAIGNSVESSGSNSFASGLNTIASGNNSFAFGDSTEASTTNAISFGDSNLASGVTSFAIGTETIASGQQTFSAGRETKSESVLNFAIGRFNIGGGNPTSWIGTDPIFEIGVGNGDLTRQNALTVLKNGNAIFDGTDVTINNNLNVSNNTTLTGQLTANGNVGINTNSPTNRLHVIHDNNGTTSGLKIENTNGNPGNYWRLYTTSAVSGNFRFYSSTNGDLQTAFINGTSGAYTATSDRRLKENFMDLYFNWDTFLKLQPLTYEYKSDKENQLHIGMVAQDVKSIYPELVSYTEDEDIYHLNYDGFGVIAIKAVQELKNEVNTLKSENAILKAKLNKLEQLEARLSALESITTKPTTLITEE